MNEYLQLFLASLFVFIEDSFEKFSAKVQSELVTEVNLDKVWKVNNFSDFNLTVIDATKNKEKIINYLRGGSKGEINLSRGDFSKMNLTLANLKGVNLENAELNGANLSGADLSGANLWRPTSSAGPFP